jgi:putative phosphoribosyl transferase
MVEKRTIIKEEVKIELGPTTLDGLLYIPPTATSLVLFAHGSGSSRHSPRNQIVAKFLQDGNIATLLFDLLTEPEEEMDLVNRELRFNIPFLTERLLGATEWVEKYVHTHSFTIGYFGASTGAAAALLAAAELGMSVKAVVSRGGRPDLANHALKQVQSPTLLIVGENDFGVIELNQKAFELLSCPKKLEVVPNATHLFEEPGTLEQVGRMAAIWFQKYLWS